MAWYVVITLDRGLQLVVLEYTQQITQQIGCKMSTMRQKYRAVTALFTAPSIFSRGLGTTLQYVTHITM